MQLADESDTDDASLDRLAVFGGKIVEAYGKLPAVISTAFAAPNTNLEAELDAVALEDDFYTMGGNTLTGGFVVSRFAGRVDFYDQLNNRVVNIVPVANLLDVVKGCDDTTQTVDVYPESLRDTLLDPFALARAQRRPVCRAQFGCVRCRPATADQLCHICRRSGGIGPFTFRNGNRREVPTVVRGVVALAYPRMPSEKAWKGIV